MTAISEKLLLYQLRTKHDPDAFAKLYDTYIERIYRFVYFKVGSAEEAEDITSEVFLKTWNFIINSKGKEIQSFSGLLYRIARNCIIDLYRRKAAHGEIKIEPESELGDGGKWYADLNKQIDNQKVIGAIKKLKQEYQEVVTLKYVDELSIEEISEITGKGNVAVRVTLHRAVKKLKELTVE